MKGVNQVESGRKYKFKRFEDDLHEELRKSKRFQRQFEVETAKLKIAEKLAQVREAMGLTQAELAKKMGVSQQLVSRIESGADNITIETLVRFFDILGMALKIEVEKRKKHQEILEFV